MKKKSKKTWIENDLINSKAFNNLTGYAPVLLLHLFQRRKFQNLSTSKRERYVCMNKDEINIPYSEFKDKFKIHKDKLARAIDQLLARGFVSLNHQGGAFKQDKSVYALSKKWNTWQPGNVIETRPKINIKRGFLNNKEANRNGQKNRRQK